MTAFSCLGADCPDTCCKEWAVDVDRETARRWRTHPDPLWRERLRAALRRVSGRGPITREIVALRADGHCPFFGEDRLCGIQKALGAELMPHICRVFPRTEEHGTALLARRGTLACVAVARAVLSEPNALDEVVEGSLVPLLPALAAPSTRPGFSVGEAYTLRRTAQAIVRHVAWSWPARLALLALFTGDVARLDLVRARADLTCLLENYEGALRGREPSGVAHGFGEGAGRSFAHLVPILRALVDTLRVPQPSKLAWFVAVNLGLQGLVEGVADVETLRARYLALAEERLRPILRERPHLEPNLLAALLGQAGFPGGRPCDAPSKLALALAAFALWRVVAVGLLGLRREDPLEVLAETAWKLGRYLAHAPKMVEDVTARLRTAGFSDPDRLVRLAL